MTIFYVLVGVFVFALIILGTLVALSLDRRATRTESIAQEPLPEGHAGHPTGHGTRYVEV